MKSKKNLLYKNCEVEMTYIKPRNKNRESTEYAMDALTKVVKVSQNYTVFACYIQILLYFGTNKILCIE